MVILVTRRGDDNTASALARVLEGHPDVRVIQERRARPLASPSAVDRRRVPAMREHERREWGPASGNRRARAVLSFDGVLT